MSRALIPLALAFAWAGGAVAQTGPTTFLPSLWFPEEGAKAPQGSYICTPRPCDSTPGK